MYWRGVVLWDGDGLEWRSRESPVSIQRFAARVPASAGIRQWITIEPHREHWMFALDWPSNAPSGAILAPGDYLWSAEAIRKPRRYEVRSFPELREKELHPRERKILLQVPAWISPAARKLVQSWTSANADPRAVVSAALHYPRTQHFRYSLSPGEYKSHDLDEFLFRRRIGFCEHYAASFATLMRVAGIPARVVVGYLGGEYNEFGRFFLVRQADTHAWCEVWLPDSGWVRIDPTSVVAPERVGLGSLAMMRAASGQTNSNAFARTLSRQPIFTKVRLAWETLSYAWDTHVLSFDADAQRSLIGDLGLVDAGPFSLITCALLIAAGLLAIYAAWMRWRTRPGGDRVKILYDRFCRKAARLGARREVWEGPAEFSVRAGRLLPNEAERINEIAHSYIALRYSAEPSPSVLAQFAREVNAFALSTGRHRG